MENVSIITLNGSEWIVSILLKNKVDTTIKNKKGFSYEDILRFNEERYEEYRAQHLHN